MKKYILTILITAFICITGTVIASNYLASEVVYNDTTVESALNELYTVHETYKNLTTETTVTPDALLNGITAYNNNGELVIGNVSECISGIINPSTPVINGKVEIAPFVATKIMFYKNDTGAASHMFYYLDTNVSNYWKIWTVNDYYGHYENNSEMTEYIDNKTLLVRFQDSNYSGNIYYTACK